MGAIRFTFSFANVNRMAPHPVHMKFIFSDADSPSMATQLSN